MNDKKMQRKLRKRAKRLLRWARKNGVGCVDIYVNAESGFMHAYGPDGATVLEFADEVAR